jgi:secreted trypsin-like serine protease
MIRLIVLLALTFLCDARPRTGLDLHASTDVDLSIIGGTDAGIGAWPWQLSQQLLSTTWSHSCGASLLSPQYALSAAHCVDGQSATTLRVIAGLNDRTNTAGTQTSNVASYKMHENYNVGSATYANDIAILTLQTSIVLGGNVALATLPPDNNNDFAGTSCTITGWGRTSSSNTLPNVLQQADINVISQSECASRIGSIGTIWANQICVYDSSNTRGACNGDSGGPLNCPTGTGGYYVAGVTSFVVSSGGNCLVTYPSIYTRSSAYLSWIQTNTP